MADNWFYVQGGTRQGPVTMEALQGMLASGQLLPTDSVWKEGMSGWALAGQVPGLMPAASPPPVQQTYVSTPPLSPRMVNKPASAISKGLRVAAIIGAGACIVSFFSPYFYVWGSVHVGSPNPPAQGPDPMAALNQTGTALPFGWGFWWGILIVIFGFLALIVAILDLAINSRILRAINKWVLLGVFGVVAILALVYVTLAIFGIGLGNVTVYGKDDPDGGTYNQLMDGMPKTADRDAQPGLTALKKKFKDDARNGTQEQKDAADKAVRDTYVSMGAIPIGAGVTLIGGVLGLASALMIVAKKK